MMGLGQVGGYRPDEVNWKWAVEKTRMIRGLEILMQEFRYASGTIIMLDR
jgi:hypothetical protein